MKVRNKIALLFLLACTCILVALVVFVYIFASRDATISFDQKMAYRLHTLQKVISDSAHKSVYLHERSLPGEKTYIIPIQDDSTFFVQNAFPIQYRNAIRKSGHAFWEKSDTVYLGEMYHWKSKDYLIMVQTINSMQKEYMSNLEKILLTGLAIALVFLLMMAIIFSRRIFTPVHVITQQVRKIGTGNLHLRLPVRKGSDEMAELTETFNDMLDRMETAFDSQKNFVSHASHEFNTPLTTIIGEAQFALSKDRTVKQYQEALDTILQESERLRDLTFNLLRLAQVQYVNQETQMEPIRLDEMLWDIRRTQEKIYPNSQISFLEEGATSDERRITVLGNVQLLHLALSNIVANASKYSHYQPVSVQLISHSRTVEIIVKDTGVGIPKEELTQIFEPYFRASNTHSFVGFGIGLPLTANIVRMHKGEITIQSEENKGTEVHVILPLYHLPSKKSIKKDK